MKNNELLDMKNVTDSKGVWFEGVLGSKEPKSGYAVIYGNVVGSYLNVAWPGSDEDDYVMTKDYGKTWWCYRCRPDCA